MHHGGWELVGAFALAQRRVECDVSGEDEDEIGLVSRGTEPDDRRIAAPVVDSRRAWEKKLDSPMSGRKRNRADAERVIGAWSGSSSA
jgi:hypothetical protein